MSRCLEYILLRQDPGAGHYETISFNSDKYSPPTRTTNHSLCITISIDHNIKDSAKNYKADKFIRKKMNTAINTRFAVLDCETTGFGKHDKICEIAVVTLDGQNFEPVEEYDTLVNPERDVGAGHIHGITATATENAPTFKEIAPVLARRLDGAVLIAHNISFDSRMVKQEFDRIDAWFNPGKGLCTMKAAGGVNLSLACKRFDVALEQYHRALADARVTAKLAKKLFQDEAELQLVSPAIATADGVPNPRTLRREATNLASTPLSRIISFAHSPWKDQPTGIYRYALNHALDDGVIDASERSQLQELAQELHLSPDDQYALHKLHLASVIASAEFDGVVTSKEREYIIKVAQALEIDDQELPETTELEQNGSLVVGMHICFTGTAMIEDSPFTRTQLETIATLAGLIPVGSVTKKGCDILVTFDTASRSGKAKKARDYGKPIISVDDFLFQTNADITG